MSHYPPNNGQSPNWQGNQSQYPSHQPWGLPPELPDQQSFYNQPTQGWQPGQMPLPPMQPPPRRRTLQQRFNALSRKGKISLGCATIVVMLSLCICSAAATANGGTNQQSAQPTTIVAVPSDTPTATVILVQAVLSTDTPTTIPTDTPTAKPTPKPTVTQFVQQPTPTPKPHCVGINNNPWCYDFNPGHLIDYPPSGFCSYFNCIATFVASDDPGDGYIVECVDSTYSQSGGERGACSGHGGESRPLYSH